MLKDVHLGCYSSTVHELRWRLKDFVNNRFPCNEKLRIVAVGHGGRDVDGAGGRGGHRRRR